MNARERLHFLLGVNEILRDSLDLGATLPRLAAHLVPALGDWCVIDVLEERRLERVAAAHADPDKRTLVSRLLGSYPFEAGAPWGPDRAARRGQFLCLPGIDDASVVVPRADAERLAVVAELGLGTVVCAPLQARAEVTGVLTCVRPAGSRPYSPSDVAAVRVVGRRTADAVAHGRLYREVQAASRAKDEFMAMLGHELRNPIAAIAQAAEVLERLDGRDDSAARFRTIIARQTRHLGRLVDDLLDVARLTSGKIVLRREPVDLKDAAERCVAALVEAGRTPADIVVDAESAVVSGDPTRLEQILANLLDNAVKYTPPEGRIEVRVRRNSESAMLAVRDTGVGIAPDLLPRVFDLFAQGPPPSTRAPGGLGIGLTLVRRLVELHGGEVVAASAGPGRGTLVEITFPLAGVASAPGLPPRRPAPAVSPRHVLIVEDNADARDALAALLDADGHHVDAVATGPEALARVRSVRPDVVFLDIGLAGMDGYQVARRLRALPGPPLTLVALTGYGQPADRRRALEAGFQVHLVKPVDPEDLGRILARLDEPVAPAASGDPGPRVDRAGGFA